jgi:hypothetical protein
MFIAIGIIGSVILGFIIGRNISGGGGFFLGLFIIFGGIVIVLEAASLTKIIIYASEDLSFCRKYLSFVADIPEEIDGELSEDDLNDENMWQCESCEWWNDKNNTICDNCNRENIT